MSGVSATNQQGQNGQLTVGYGLVSLGHKYKQKNTNTDTNTKKNTKLHKNYGLWTVKDYQAKSIIRMDPDE